MGIGGAMMWPAILGMTYALLPESKAGLAGGLILGAAGFGNAVGPLLGGVLTDALSWRWIFFLNLPIAAFAMLVTWRKVAPRRRSRSTTRRIDYAGIATLSVGAARRCCSRSTRRPTGAGPTRGSSACSRSRRRCSRRFAFIERARRRSARWCRATCSRNRLFRAACLAILLMSAIFFSALLYLPQFMQKILGYSALEAGAGLLPMMGVFALTSFVAGPLYSRLGREADRLAPAPRASPSASSCCRCSTPTRATRALVPGMVVLGVGVGLFYSSVTTAGVTALDPSRASLAGGIVYMCQIAGGSIGLGLDDDDLHHRLGEPGRRRRAGAGACT